MAGRRRVRRRQVRDDWGRGQDGELEEEGEPQGALGNPAALAGHRMFRV